MMNDKNNIDKRTAEQCSFSFAKPLYCSFMVISTFSHPPHFSPISPPTTCVFTCIVPWR